jgi:hypothetical protein
VSDSEPQSSMSKQITNSYLATILGGTKNPHYGEVAKDIVDSVLKTRADRDGPATYWDKGEQESRLRAAFQKWAEQANVWSAAAEKVSLQY